MGTFFSKSPLLSFCIGLIFWSKIIHDVLLSLVRSAYPNFARDSDYYKGFSLALDRQDGVKKNFGLLRGVLFRRGTH